MTGFDFDPEHFIGGAVGAGGAAAAGIWAWSKLRRILAHDAVDSSAHDAMRLSMQQLRDENTRLHDEVIRLRNEVNRLQTVISDLTQQIASMSAMLARSTVEDQLAREGRLERRKRGETTSPFPPFSLDPQS